MLQNANAQNVHWKHICRQPQAKLPTANSQQQTGKASTCEFNKALRNIANSHIHTQAAHTHTYTNTDRGSSTALSRISNARLGHVSAIIYNILIELDARQRQQEPEKRERRRGIACVREKEREKRQRQGGSLSERPKSKMHFKCCKGPKRRADCVCVCVCVSCV